MTIRRATTADGGFVAGLAPSFVAFGLPGGRDPDAHAAVFARELEEALAADAEIYVVEDDGERLGFVHMQVRQDHAGHPRAHVSDLAVAEAAQGRGVATELLAFAERWAVERGHDVLSLSVFATNTRARRALRASRLRAGRAHAHQAVRRSQDVGTACSALGELLVKTEHRASPDMRGTGR